MAENNDLLISNQVANVLEGLANELVEIPAEHDGKGGYKLDYFVLMDWFLSPPPEFLIRLVGYANAKALLAD